MDRLTYDIEMYNITRMIASTISAAQHEKLINIIASKFGTIPPIIYLSIHPSFYPFKII